MVELDDVSRLIGVEQLGQHEGVFQDSHQSSGFRCAQSVVSNKAVTQFAFYAAGMWHRHAHVWRFGMFWATVLRLGAFSPQ